MTAGEFSRLCADVATAPDERHIVDLVTDNLKEVAKLSEREVDRLLDTIRERRAFLEEGDDDE